VADADGNATDSFDLVRVALDTATFPAPSRAFSIEDVGGLRVAVYLVPGDGETGTLEHLFLKAVFDQTPQLATCLDEFSTCTKGLQSPKPNNLAKMRMSALAAAFCQDNPWCNVNAMLGDPNNPVPIASKHFGHLTDFLIKFRS
jgi:hypothetical protein